MNFFEPGDGKNDMDHHFGKIHHMEKRFLFQFDEIEGMFFCYEFLFDFFNNLFHRG